MKGLLAIINALFFLLLFSSSCEKFQEDEDFPSTDFISEGSFRGDYWPTDEWRYCAPGEVNVNRKKLIELNEEVLLMKDLHVNIHSILIIKDGYVIAEQYYSDDYGPDSLHFIASCTKSITSALLGIAMNQGYPLSLDDRMVDFFPDYEIQNMSENKEAITLEHMLTMSSGLEWTEMEYLYSDDRNSFRQWIRNGGGIDFVLNQPSVAPPGEEYAYNSGISHVLSGILQRTTGIRTDSFAREVLFEPLGIDQFQWRVDDKGVAYGGSSMRLTPRDMARFGLLYLRGGMWDGVQLIPEDWVYSSQQQHIKRKYIEDYYYGYHWWVGEDHSYSAVGYAGQWITIFPEHNMVVVFTNDFEDGEKLQWDTPQRLVETYILPALK